MISLEANFVFPIRPSESIPCNSVPSTKTSTEPEVAETVKHCSPPPPVLISVKVAEIVTLEAGIVNLLSVSVMLLSAASLTEIVPSLYPEAGVTVSVIVSPSLMPVVLLADTVPLVIPFKVTL